MLLCIFDMTIKQVFVIASGMMPFLRSMSKSDTVHPCESSSIKQASAWSFQRKTAVQLVRNANWLTTSTRFHAHKRTPTVARPCNLKSHHQTGVSRCSNKLDTAEREAHNRSDKYRSGDCNQGSHMPKVSMPIRYNYHFLLRKSPLETNRATHATLGTILLIDTSICITHKTSLTSEHPCILKCLYTYYK